MSPGSVRSRVRSPTTTGKIERFHQSLRKEFLADRAFASIDEAQAELDAWVRDYNTVRPHQALEMATPADRFRLAPISKDQASIPVDQAEDHRGQWVLRRVGSNGMVSVDNQLFSVTNAFKGELVDVFVDDTVIQAWRKNHLIRTVAREPSGPVRKLRGWSQRQDSAEDSGSSIRRNLTRGTSRGGTLRALFRAIRTPDRSLMDQSTATAPVGTEALESSSASVRGLSVAHGRPQVVRQCPYVISQFVGCGWSIRGLPSIGTRKNTTPSSTGPALSFRPT